MVLGVDWLHEVNPVTFDFRKLTLQFTYQGKGIVLQGATDRASLRVIGVELLEDITGQKNPWMTQLNNINTKHALNLEML